MALALAGLLLGLVPSVPAKAAACAVPTTDYGTATLSLTTPAAATYRVWSRVNVPDTTNNTFLLEIDGTNCYTVGGSSVSPNTWTWVDYQNTGTANKVELSLSQGAHTVKLIGNAGGVKVDRLLAVSDTTCVPTDLGDNCNTPTDTTPPTVSLTAPTNGSTVTGTVTVAANATDDTGVTKVEFYDNSTLLNTSTTAPYTASWDTTKAPNGNHVLTAKAYDAAGNIGTDTSQVSVQNGDNQAPTTPTGVSAAAISATQIKVSWAASTDNVGVTGYTIVRDGVPLVNVGNVTSYTDSQGVLPSTSYQYQVIAFDAAGNTSTASNTVSVTTPSAPDSQAPTAPSNLQGTAISSSQVNLSWTASTDNVGVAKYVIYRATGTSTSFKQVGTSTTPSFGNTGLSANTKYTYYVVAKDAAGNTSGSSNKITVTTPASKKKYQVTGTITSSTTGQPVAHTLVTIRVGGNTHYYQANSRGQYATMRLAAGRYSITYRATGYKAYSTSVKVDADTVIQNVTLTKK